MAEPTLKDVLKALTRMSEEIAEIRAETKSESTQTRNEMHAFRSELKDRVDSTFRRTIQPEIIGIRRTIEEELPTKAEMHAFRSEMTKRFDAIDAELTVHSEKVHRAIEADLQYLKGRPARTGVRAPRRRPAK